MTDDLIARARAAARDDRLADGALYGQLADAIEQEIRNWKNRNNAACAAEAKIRQTMENIRERFRDAKEKAKASASISLNSYGSGYDLGYHDALGELLESLTDDVSAATERNDG